MELGNGGFRLLLKREKGIERFVYFVQGLLPAVSELAHLVVSEFWGKSNWSLVNFVDQVFSRQQYQGHIYHSECKNLFYMNTTLYTPMGDMILMELEPQNTEVMYIFKRWVRLHKSSMLPNEVYSMPLLDPDWGISPDAIRFNTEMPVDTHIKHVFGQHKKRILSAIDAAFPFSPFHQDFAMVEVWFGEELERQLDSARRDPALVVPQWFNTKKSLGLLLPLFLRGKLVLVAAIEIVHRNSVPMYNIVTVLLPMWAYNNARILGPVKSTWLNSSALEMGECGRTLPFTPMA